MRLNVMSSSSLVLSDGVVVLFLMESPTLVDGTATADHA